MNKEPSKTFPLSKFETCSTGKLNLRLGQLNPCFIQTKNGT